MKFHRFNQYCRLDEERLSGFNYHIPNSKEERLYDFYMIAHFQGDIHGKRDENLQWAIENVEDELLFPLKDDLLEGLFYALAAELRHINDTLYLEDNINYNNIVDAVVDYVGKNAGPGGKSSIKKYLREYFKYQKIDRSMGDLLSRRDKEVGQPFIDLKQNKESYNASYRAAKKAYKNNEHQFARVCELIFDADNAPFRWQSNYGGENWGNIARGFLRLFYANNKRGKTHDNLYIAIDHVYDLHHNTGVVFNKVQEYYDGRSNMRWFKDALDFKAHLKDVRELYDKVSPSMRILAGYAIKEVYGNTIEDFRKQKKVEKKKKEEESNLVVVYANGNVTNTAVHSINELTKAGGVVFKNQGDKMLIYLMPAFVKSKALEVAKEYDLQNPTIQFINRQNDKSITTVGPNNYKFVFDQLIDKYGKHNDDSGSGWGELESGVGPLKGKNIQKGFVISGVGVYTEHYLSEVEKPFIRTRALKGYVVVEKNLDLLMVYYNPEKVKADTLKYLLKWDTSMINNFIIYTTNGENFDQRIQTTKMNAYEDELKTILNSMGDSDKHATPFLKDGTTSGYVVIHEDGKEAVGDFSMLDGIYEIMEVTTYGKVVIQKELNKRVSVYYNGVYTNKLPLVKAANLLVNAKGIETYHSFKINGDDNTHTNTYNTAVLPAFIDHIRNIASKKNYDSGEKVDTASELIKDNSKAGTILISKEGSKKTEEGMGYDAIKSNAHKGKVVIYKSLNSMAVWFDPSFTTKAALLEILSLIHSSHAMEGYQLREMDTSAGTHSTFSTTKVRDEAFADMKEYIVKNFGGPSMDEGPIDDPEDNIAMSYTEQMLGEHNKPLHIDDTGYVTVYSQESINDFGEGGLEGGIALKPLNVGHLEVWYDIDSVTPAALKKLDNIVDQAHVFLYFKQVNVYDDVDGEVSVFLKKPTYTVGNKQDWQQLSAGNDEEGSNTPDPLEWAKSTIEEGKGVLFSEEGMSLPQGSTGGITNSGSILAYKAEDTGRHIFVLNEDMVNKKAFIRFAEYVVSFKLWNEEGGFSIVFNEGPTKNIKSASEWDTFENSMYKNVFLPY